MAEGRPDHCWNKRGPPKGCRVPARCSTQQNKFSIHEAGGPSGRRGNCAVGAFASSSTARIDAKTGAIVDYLFSYRGRSFGQAHLNNRLIPMLCRKAGVEERDARGNITSHRARSTIASQLYNAKDTMTLIELKEWLGHRWLSSTQNYTMISPTKLAKSFVDVGYFKRNIRTIEVLIDQDAIKSGTAAAGEPWKFYDLGHGYCTYDFSISVLPLGA